MGIVLSQLRNTRLKIDKNDGTLERPNCYHGREGPDFMVLDYNDLYKTQQLNATMWVTTVIEGKYIEAWDKGVVKLKNYANGQNQEKCILPETCPIIMKRYRNHLTNQKQEGDREITVSMLIPKSHVHCVPMPTNRDLFIQEEEKRICFTSRARKGLNFLAINNDIDDIVELLKYNQEKFEEDYNTIAIYNTSSNNLTKSDNYEYWLYGEKLEQSYISL